MRRSLQLALATLLTALPLTAQDKPSTAVTLGPTFKAVPCPEVFKAVPCPECPDALGPQVSCEIKLIRVSDAVMEQFRLQSAPDAAKPVRVRKVFGDGLLRVGVDFDMSAADEKRRVVFATPAEMKKLLEKMQASSATKVLQAPKVTLLAGKTASVQSLDRRNFVTEVTMKTVDGQPTFTPKMEAVELGFNVSLTATPAADESTVKLSLDARVTELADGAAPKTPVTMELKGVTADGKPTTVPFTQFVDQPKVVTRAVKDSLTVPTGHSAILYAGPATREQRTESGPPMLSKIPYVSRLFKNVAYGKETDHLLVVVTPTVLSEIKQASATEAKLLGDGQLPRLLKAYHDACAAGKKDDARRLAIECLVVDPTCFGKK